jgi:hypothetical protein
VSGKVGLSGRVRVVLNRHFGTFAARVVRVGTALATWKIALTAMPDIWRARGAALATGCRPVAWINGPEWPLIRLAAASPGGVVKL